MSQIRGKTAWLALNQIAQRQTLKEAISGAQLEFARGNWLRLNCALFAATEKQAGNLVTDISNIVSVTLVMRKTDALGEVLYHNTIPAAEFDNPALTFESWAARGSRHFSFLLTAEETNWPLAGWDGKIYYVFGIDTSDEGPITVSSGFANVYEDGIGEAPETVVNDPIYDPRPVADVRNLLRHEAGAIGGALLLVDDGAGQPVIPPEYLNIGESNVFDGGWYP